MTDSWLKELKIMDYLSEVFNCASHQAAHTKGELQVMHYNQLIFSI